MLAAIRHVLTSPATGPIATAVAFVLAVALGVSASGWESQRDAYESRIAALSHTAARAETGLRAELAACHAARRPAPDPTPAVQGETSAVAKRLLDRQPEGIDACARMESADQAVLSNLKK